MGKSIDELYQEMMTSSLLDTFNLATVDDEEEFMTSKEIVEQKKKLEEQFPSRPGQGPRGGTPGKIEEEVHFKRYNTTKRQHKYSEREMEEIRESCMGTIVHDYGPRDIYHMTDEERKENDMLAELRPKLGALKRIYYKVDQYVEAMRVVMEAWAVLEKNNYIHSTEEFYELISKGKIYSNSIIMPKLKKANNYNMDVIIQYISNPDADASQLTPMIPEQKDPFYDQFTIDEDPWYNYFYDEELDRIIEEEKDKPEEEKLDSYGKRDRAHEYATKMLQQMMIETYLDPDEAEYIQEHMDNPEEIQVQDMKRKYYKNYDRRTFTTKKKKKGKKNKTEQYIIETTHRILNRIQANSIYNRGNDFSRSYLITQSMFNSEKPLKDFWSDKRFQGSWANKYDVLLYDLQLREALLEQRPEGQRFYTYADQQLSEFFRALEDHGINTLDLRRRMNLTTNMDVTIGSSLESDAKKKENKKLESAILQRITKFNRDPKFKKLINKAEKALNKRFEEGG